MHYQVFVGAPSPSDIGTDYVWQTLSSDSVGYPEATLRRISALYQNVIFDNSDDDEDLSQDDPPSAPDGTTFVTWPPTPAPNTAGAPSFLLRPSGSLPQATYETQETGSSFQYSDASSIACFPDYHFSLHNVTSLASLDTASKSGRGSRKVNVLLAVLEVQGPDSVRAKKGVDVGQQISLLKLILTDDQGAVCKLTAWRDTADTWGGLGPSPGLKRGDVVYFESTSSIPYLMATWEPGSTVTLTASPYNRPLAVICYRTMPYTHEDNRLRPDLRLGQSDAVVSKVAALVRWFENMAGLPGA